MVQGKSYQWYDPAWTVFNCNLEVVQVSGNLAICQEFQMISSSHIESANYANKRFGVVNDSYKKYLGTIALSNHPASFVGQIISPPIRAIPVGSTSIVTTYRTGGLIDQQANRSQSYSVYDVGTDYIPPQRKLTPEEQKIQAQRKAEAKLREFQYIQTQASNGVASAQRELGLAYLKGDGVESNRFLGINWLGKAAVQGDSQAHDALEKIIQVKTNSVAN